MSEEQGTKFLNVDLDIVSKTPLESLVEAFGEKVDVLYVGRGRRQYKACLEVASSGRPHDQADTLIRRFVSLVKALPRAPRRLWEGAQSRGFNIGIEAAAESSVFELYLEPETLMAVAGVAGRIIITVYPEMKNTTVAKPQRKRIAK